MYFMIIMKLSKLWKNLNAVPSLDIFFREKKIIYVNKLKKLRCDT